MKIRDDRTRGFSLAIAFAVLAILVALAVSLALTSEVHLRQTRAAESATVTLHAANGGLHELMDRLYVQDDYGVGVGDSSLDTVGSYTTSELQSEYWWSFDATGSEPYCVNNLDGPSALTGYGGRPVPPYTALLTVAARPDGQDGDGLPARVAALVRNRWPYAILSDGPITGGDVTSTIPGLGNVRSNEVGGAPNILLDSIDGAAISRDPEGSIDVSGQPEGLHLFDQDPVAVPDLPIDDIIASYSPAGVSGTRPYGGPGDYSYGPGSITATTDADGNVLIGTDTIQPPATVYVEGNLRFGGSTSLVAQGIHLFVTGDVRFNGSLEQVTGPSSAPGSGPLPMDANFLLSGGEVRFNGATTQNFHIMATTGIRQNGSSDYRGLLYVREGGLDLNGDQRIVGTAMARDGATTGGDVGAPGSGFVYDPAVLEDLESFSLKVRGPVQILSWWLED